MDPVPVLRGPADPYCWKDVCVVVAARDGATLQTLEAEAWL